MGTELPYKISSLQNNGSRSIKFCVFKFFFSFKGMADNLLKEILDSLTDVDSINLFAAANGLTGDTEVENRLREVEWNHHIDNLWEEILLDLESAPKRPRQSDEDDQPSFQFGGGDAMEEKPYYIWKKNTRTFKKNLAHDTCFKIMFNDQWQGGKLVDIYQKLHDYV